MFEMNMTMHTPFLRADNITQTFPNTLPVCTGGITGDVTDKKIVQGRSELSIGHVRTLERHHREAEVETRLGHPRAGINKKGTETQIK